jgi:predicted dehydrogenase
LDEGLLGDVQLLEMPTVNLFDWGTHWFDMMFFYNNQVPAVSVLGQVEPTGGGSVFGVKLEGKAISQIEFENGVHAIAPTGKTLKWHVQNRITGTKGRIEIGATGWDSFRIWTEGQSQWQDVSEWDYPAGSTAIGRGIRDLAESLEAGTEPQLAGRKALMATELIFATYESSRQAKLIHLPLEVEDSEVLAE